MNATLSRRDILRRSAFAATGLALAGVLPSLASAADAPKKKIPIALELYSLRNELKTDFNGVIQQVGKMGYEGIEFAGYYAWDKKPKELRKLLDDSGLKCCGTHTPLITLQGDALKSTVDLHKELGNSFLICPSLSAKDAEGWANLGKRFTEIAAKLKEHGMFVGYHAHGGDFKKFGDKTSWEIFYDNAGKDVIHQIDTGNTLGGGGDPLAMIKKYPGQTKSTHIKEFGGGPEAAIGEGKIDWKPLLEAYQTVGGTEWYIIEHETSKTPITTVKKCLDNLRKMTA
ncbi:sugar phosphate isomerase/epimerase family protein [Humisphaera borealis]|uniref:Sugar phosphate isomerase/epimerase n=1 Tax=Humisphaera borealis TaxID=2807512 RepID=A0A7M2WT12_9BACT|nr:sugar phosphate isomerase/epimerase [Humisphaera borealis]QOV88563.1 sugar phosphate isomerase/epimerase [Humisphaera borealis]